MGDYQKNKVFKCILNKREKKLNEAERILLSRLLYIMNTRLVPVEAKILNTFKNENIFDLVKEYKKDLRPLVYEGFRLIDFSYFNLKRTSYIKDKVSIYTKEYIFSKYLYKDKYKTYSFKENRMCRFKIKEPLLTQTLNICKAEQNITFTKSFEIIVDQTLENKKTFTKNINNFISWLKENNYKFDYAIKHKIIHSISIRVREIEFLKIF